MIIAIPLEENRESVCASFGRAPYFMLHNNETNTSEVKANPAASAEGGAGIKAAQFVLDAGAGAVITVRCGQNAADVFKTAGTKVYKALHTGANENLTALAEGKLEELTDFHPGFRGRA